MTLFNPWTWRNVMFFHYGHCKQELIDLKKENANLKAELLPLFSQIQEQKGILDYTLFGKEQKIAALEKEISRYIDEIGQLKSKIADLSKPKEKPKKTTK